MQFSIFQLLRGISASARYVSSHFLSTHQCSWFLSQWMFVQPVDARTRVLSFNISNIRRSIANSRASFESESTRIQGRPFVVALLSVNVASKTSGPVKVDNLLTLVTITDEYGRISRDIDTGWGHQAIVEQKVNWISSREAYMYESRMVVTTKVMEDPYQKAISWTPHHPVICLVLVQPHFPNASLSFGHQQCDDEQPDAGINRQAPGSYCLLWT
ncbi:hypothetical protein ARMSODRAFT_980422 [Armillaria solidipes]|uniref:Uncharacterized protein n=1 Tax=Armillaria solidipes TaxID=1076256 RepID=A0A2H3AVK5_9AGAR|nr:hypothetical protein ARMSODRAFT_980422 [Armillaria solidipes]